MDTVEREFTDHGHYFSLWEISSRELIYDMVTKTLKDGPPRTWAKTHIAISKCAVTGDIGVQIIRFQSNAAKEALDLMPNPYAGIYLKPEEWDVIQKRLANPIW